MSYRRMIKEMFPANALRTVWLLCRLHLHIVSETSYL